MSLIVEDGTGTYSATAESYISVANADTYFTNRANAVWVALTTATKEACLRKATDYMVNEYQTRWLGVRMQSSVNQLLDWPRAYVYTEPFLHGAVGEFPYLVPNNIVPLPVMTACAELAFRASTMDLNPDLTQKVLKESVGPISVTYDPTAPAYMNFRQIDNILKVYLKGGGNSGMVKLTRC
jgi:hypothetical protein